MFAFSFKSRLVGRGESVRKALEKEERSTAWIAEKASQTNTMDESIAVGQNIMNKLFD
jgi:hypothetical protein